MGFLANLIKAGVQRISEPVKYITSEIDEAFYTKKEREADEAAKKAAEDEKKRLEDEANLEKIQERLAGITGGTIEIDPRVVDEREAGAWLLGLFNPLDTMKDQNQLTMEQRNMARILDNRFEYDWDIPDESAFTLYNRIRPQQDESSSVTHIEDTNHPTDREDDVARPADKDENKTGLTADDQRTIYAPMQETAEDYFGTGGADPGEKEPDSFLEGWFDSLFSEPTNNDNDALYNGEPDRSMGEKAVMVGLYGLGGCISGLAIGSLAQDKLDTSKTTTILTAVGLVAGVVASYA